ncbi:MAG: hypothetical protein NTW65_05930 [Deltaproteobacteria bacterium]|nr:hypothetical protein [Deltaproteobacteria bacterium]
MIFNTFSVKKLPMYDDKIKHASHIMGCKESIVLIFAFITGGILRLLSASDNLWFDEIWSVNFARSMQSFWDVFKIHHDNNHILNTLYLYFFGFGAVWSKYRLLSIITGALAVPIIGYIGFRRSFLSGLVVSVLAAFSYPLIVYSSEARGYAPAMLFALTAYAAFQYYNKERSPLILFSFWISSIAGILSHLTFFYIFAGFFISSIFRVKESLNKIINPLKELAAWHLIPSCFMVFLYLFFVKGIVIGGGESIGAGLERLSDFLSPVVGLMPGSIISIIPAFLLFIAVSAWILIAERKLSPDWIFYAVILVTVPLLAFIVPVDFFGSRYIALLLPFLYLILALILTKITSFPRFGIIICIILISLFAFGNVRRINDQLSTGRGNYLDAVKYIMYNSHSSRVSIITDHEFRNLTVIDFYKQFIPMSKEIDYISYNDILYKKKEAPEWLVMHHRFEPGFTPPISRSIEDKKYKLVKISPSANILSGWNWYIYKKQW